MILLQTIQREVSGGSESRLDSALRNAPLDERASTVHQIVLAQETHPVTPKRPSGVHGNPSSAEPAVERCQWPQTTTGEDDATGADETVACTSDPAGGQLNPLPSVRSHCRSSDSVTRPPKDALLPQLPVAALAATLPQLWRAAADKYVGPLMPRPKLAWAAELEENYVLPRPIFPELTLDPWKSKDWSACHKNYSSQPQNTGPHHLLGPLKASDVPWPPSPLSSHKTTAQSRCQYAKPQLHWRVPSAADFATSERYQRQYDASRGVTGDETLLSTCYWQVPRHLRVMSGDESSQKFAEARMTMEAHPSAAEEVPAMVRIGGADYPMPEEDVRRKLFDALLREPTGDEPIPPPRRCWRKPPATSDASDGLPWRKNTDQVRDDEEKDVFLCLNPGLGAACARTATFDDGQLSAVDADGRKAEDNSTDRCGVERKLAEGGSDALIAHGGGTVQTGTCEEPTSQSPQVADDSSAGRKSEGRRGTEAPSSKDSHRFDSDSNFARIRRPNQTRGSERLSRFNGNGAHTSRSKGRMSTGMKCAMNRRGSARSSQRRKNTSRHRAVSSLYQPASSSQLPVIPHRAAARKRGSVRHVKGPSKTHSRGRRRHLRCCDTCSREDPNTATDGAGHLESTYSSRRRLASPDSAQDHSTRTASASSRPYRSPSPRQRSEGGRRPYPACEVCMDEDLSNVEYYGISHLESTYSSRRHSVTTCDGMHTRSPSRCSSRASRHPPNSIH